ncbi:MAG: AAA family ATPase [Acidobacteriota bacterium]
MSRIVRLEPDRRAVASGFGDPDALPMHEEFFGFTEKPFSLTPDPKYLYKSQSHANAFDLLQYAIRRREGFVVVTGDIGTGKTTLCRAILEQLDRRTFTALVLNPFISEDDLLRLILQDFGVVSRDELKRGRLIGISKQEMIDALNEFLLSLQPLRAGALLIIDEAQNLPHQVLEQIRILSNLETDKEKLLQIVLVGQLNLKDVLRLPELRQLDQRVSIRYELKPLTRDETSAYIAHRLMIAGGGSLVSFAPKALDLVHQYSGGIPRLINLVCDRALLGGYSARAYRITPEMVTAAAKGLDLLLPPTPASAWVRQRAGAFAAGAALMAAVAAAAFLFDGTHLRRAPGGLTAGAPGMVSPDQPDSQAAAAAPSAPASVPASVPVSPPPPELVVSPTSAAPPSPVGTAAAVPAALTAPADVTAPGPGTYSVLVGSFRHEGEAASLVGILQGLGYRARTGRVQSGERGTWYQVFAGPYAELDRARQDETRVRQMPGYADAHLIRH